MTDRIGNTDSPEQSEILRRVMTMMAEGLFVAFPGKVEVYDPVNQKATVKPLLKRAEIMDDGTEEVDDLPVLMEVPVLFQRGGGYFITFPIASGDNVLLIVCDKSIDNYMYTPGNIAVDPVDLRNHDLSDAVAIPGFYTFIKVITDVVAAGMVMGKEKGYQVRVNDGAVEVTTGGLAAAVGGYVAMATLVATELNKIKTGFDVHTHNDSLGAPTTTPMGIPTKVPWVVGSTASTNLKAD